MPLLRAENQGPIEIYYEEAGAGTPVVLIGGLTSTVEVWGRQVPALATRHRVVTPDNRGSGRTRVAGDDGVRAPERFAGDVLALLDRLGLERVHLFGASMGGVIVQAFALRWPERLRSLVIACSTPGGPNAVAAAPEVIQALVAGSAEGAPPEAARAALGVVFHPGSFAARPDAVAFYEGTKRAWPHAVAEIARRAAGIAGFDAWEGLASLAVPTLVLTGADDRLVPPENSRRLAARIPGAELCVIPESAHVFFVEQPDATNRALLEFFAKH
jgi:pimeloyl-ACP methyl ester carboxylesterase